MKTLIFYLICISLHLAAVVVTVSLFSWNTSSLVFAFLIVFPILELMIILLQYLGKGFLEK